MIYDSIFDFDFRIFIITSLLFQPRNKCMHLVLNNNTLLDLKKQITSELFEGRKGLINLFGFITFCGLTYHFSEPMNLSDQPKPHDRDRDQK
jgi:hypothetical protein